jgi:hypothetical protein
MSFSSGRKAPNHIWSDVRDGVLVASAVALLAYLIHETTSPDSNTRAFLDNQRRLRVLGEELLQTVRQLDGRLQTLVEKQEALVQQALTQQALTPQASKPATTRRSAAKSQTAAKPRAAKGAGESAAS